MNPTITKILENEKIPSPPAVAARLLELASKPDVQIDAISKVLSADPKLSARIIDYCNSPIVAPMRTISSLQQAVTLLGLRTLRLLSLSFSLMDTRSGSSFPYETFWRQSLANAIAAKLFARKVGSNGDESFLFGLVFNIGVIGIGATFSEELRERFGDEDLLQELNPDVERTLFDANRFEIGAHLLELWNFPSDMIKALRDYDPNDLTENSKLFFVSQASGELLLAAEPCESQILEARQSAEEMLGISHDDFDEIFDGMVEEWRGYETLFDFDTIAFDSIQELEAKAKASMVQISLGMERTINEMTVQHEELRELALIDGLTKLKNRSAYDKEVGGILDFHQRQSKSFAMIVADIDHFKKVNDTYGHAAGDSVLRSVAACLKENARLHDTVYRFGGEEFAVVVVDCDFESSCAVAERLRKSVEELRIEFEGKVLNVTSSFGICWVESGNLNNIDCLFGAADANLYQAKRSGRNRCVATKSWQDSVAYKIDAPSEEPTFSI